MEALSKYFDHYVISARIKPAFFAVLPLAATFAVWWPNAQQLGGAVLTLLVTFGAVGFFSNLISNRGNELQARLFSDWGGAPTTTLLRFADTTLDHHTKMRYHRCLEAIIPGLKLPAEIDELADCAAADACYLSAVNYLREHTRDKESYPMVYADNVAYGYARNLLVMKTAGMISAGAALVINVVLLFPAMRNMVPGQVDSGIVRQVLFGICAGGLSVIMLWVFSVVVNAGYVKGRAERYAKSLLATCERVGA